MGFLLKAVTFGMLGSRESEVVQFLKDSNLSHLKLPTNQVPKKAKLLGTGADGDIYQVQFDKGFNVVVKVPKDNANAGEVTLDCHHGKVAHAACPESTVQHYGVVEGFLSSKQTSACVMEYVPLRKDQDYQGSADAASALGSMAEAATCLGLNQIFIGDVNPEHSLIPDDGSPVKYYNFHGSSVGASVVSSFKVTAPMIPQWTWDTRRYNFVDLPAMLNAQSYRNFCLSGNDAFTLSASVANALGVGHAHLFPALATAPVLALVGGPKEEAARLVKRTGKQESAWRTSTFYKDGQQIFTKVGDWMKDQFKVGAELPEFVELIPSGSTREQARALTEEMCAWDGRLGSLPTVLSHAKLEGVVAWMRMHLEAYTAKFGSDANAPDFAVVPAELQELFLREVEVKVQHVVGHPQCKRPAGLTLSSRAVSAFLPKNMEGVRASPPKTIKTTLCHEVFSTLLLNYYQIENSSMLVGDVLRQLGAVKQPFPVQM